MRAPDDSAVYLLLPLSATGTISLPLPISELTFRADTIVRGVVVSRVGAWDKAHRRIRTVTEVRVSESWKGAEGPGAIVRIRQLGGTVGSVTQSVAGDARFRLGQEVLVFLRSDPARGLHYMVGMAQGRFGVSGATGKEDARRDLRGLELPGDAAPPERMGLADLERQVRARSAW